MGRRAIAERRNADLAMGGEGMGGEGREGKGKGREGKGREGKGGERRRIFESAEVTDV